ncbi:MULTISPECIES: hypothetical protein [Mycobacterium]|uniref:hypothetical protein n=1 Tax=Mycobacterium TaxID=1763 RepID=UPI001EF158CE|nr:MULTISPECIES: hypothetical protein [Mycobacterium]GLD05466.1 hypothetical protein Mkiyose1383_17920 [Mycobacterium kiyosense]
MDDLGSPDTAISPVWHWQAMHSLPRAAKKLPAASHTVDRPEPAGNGFEWNGGAVTRSNWISLARPELSPPAWHYLTV